MYNQLVEAMQAMAKKKGLDVSDAFEGQKGVLGTYDGLKKHPEFSGSWKAFVENEIGIPEGCWYALNLARKRDPDALLALVHKEKLQDKAEKKELLEEAEKKELLNEAFNLQKDALDGLVQEEDLSDEALKKFSAMDFPESAVAQDVLNARNLSSAAPAKETPGLSEAAQNLYARLAKYLKSNQKDRKRLREEIISDTETYPDSAARELVSSSEEELVRLANHLLAERVKRHEAVSTLGAGSAQVHDAPPDSVEEVPTIPQTEAVKVQETPIEVVVAPSPKVEEPKPQETQVEVVVEKPKPKLSQEQIEARRKADAEAAAVLRRAYGSPTVEVAVKYSPAEATQVTQAVAQERKPEPKATSDKEEVPPAEDPASSNLAKLLREAKDDKSGELLGKIARGTEVSVSDEDLIAFQGKEGQDKILQFAAFSILQYRQLLREADARKARRESERSESFRSDDRIPLLDSEEVMPPLDEDLVRASTRWPEEGNDWREDEPKPNFLQRNWKELIAFVAILVLASFGGFIWTSFRDLFLGESGSLLPAVFSVLLIVIALYLVRLCAETRSWVSHYKAKAYFEQGVILCASFLLLGLITGYVVSWRNQPVIVATNTESDVPETPEAVVETPLPQVVEIAQDAKPEGWPWGSQILQVDKKDIPADILGAITEDTVEGGVVFYYWAKARWPDYAYQAWEWDQFKADTRSERLPRSTSEAVKKRQDALISGRDLGKEGPLRHLIAEVEYALTMNK